MNNSILGTAALLFLWMKRHAKREDGTMSIIRAIPIRSIIAIVIVICVLLPLPWIVRYLDIHHAWTDNNELTFKSDASDGVVMDDSFENIVWFLQSTDIHYKVDVPSRHEKYHAFLTKARDEWRPAFIINTGDTTDAVIDFPFVRGQIEGEWDMYVTDLEATGWDDPLRYIDMIGNHDAMNSGSPRSDMSLFFARTPTGKLHFSDVTQISDDRGAQTVTMTVERRGDLLRLDYPMPLDNLTLLLMNLPQTDPGLTAPANFYGNLIDSQVEAIQDAFPTDSIVITAAHQCARWTQVQTLTKTSFKSIVSRNNTALHLCGHIHRRGYSRFGDNHTPEISTTSFAHTRFQAVVVDHGLASVHDQLGTGPLLLPSNPPQGHMLSTASPVHRVLQSSHIRAIYSGACPDTATVVIDGSPKALSCTLMPSGYEYALPGTGSISLLTAEWDPSLYDDDEMHWVEFNVTAGTTDTACSYAFSVNGKATPLGSVKDSIVIEGNNTGLMFMHWPLFWALILFTSLVAVILVTMLPIHLSLTTVKSGDGTAYLHAEWKRHPVIFALALAFAFLPNFIVKMNGQDWALVFSFAIFERGHVVFDTFLYMIPLVMGLVMFIPTTAMLAVISAYKAYHTHIRHLKLLAMAKADKGLLARCPPGFPLHLVTDVIFVGVVLAFLGVLLVLMGLCYMLTWQLWVPDIPTGIVSILFSPSLLLTQTLIVLTVVWEAITVGRLRLMPVAKL
ncbi:hypothetical protein J8273_1342 [Carpediemonas membranifera]|uniref:Calcineurin-like phosphoesterase domain-containing protein n=1 Tax=Carpediemonas membranifera TaxID=201153 RepID=A0A8J6B716_9EUKA|nr:hypothetical protein J8273_1342 [Carpediemonas membranifera]|eukprot:KAG9396993.1 hypothetical protein J8273_1342 [Carpediemonas membranifera]